MERVVAASLVVGLAACLLGCGDDSSMAIPPDDAGRADDATVAPPPRPAAPVLTPCPSGWREVTEDGLVLCDPWPAGGPATCAAGEAHFVGASGCASVGAPCPSGDFSESLPAGASVLHVLAGAPVGGDGSESRPFAAIGEALLLASPDTVIAVGKGTYDEALDVPAGVTLVGACATESVLTVSTWAPRSSTVAVRAAGVTIRDIGVVMSERRAILVEGTTASLELDGAILAAPVGEGIVVDAGGTLIAREVVIRGTRPRGSDGRASSAIGPSRGARATVERVVVERALGWGVVVLSGGELTASDVAIREIQPDPIDETVGQAIAGMDGTMHVTRAVLEQTRQAAVTVQGGTAELADVVIRDTLEQVFDGFGGHALLVTGGATLTGQRLRIDRSRYTAILVDAASITLTDAVVRDTASRPANGRAGSALFVQRPGASGTVERAVFSRSRDVAVVAIGDGASLRLTDTVVDGALRQQCSTTTCADSPSGSGIGSYLGAVVEARRFAVSHAALCGVQVARSGRMDLHDGEVAFCLAGACVGVDGYDIARLSDGVRYHDNESNLDSSELPVPEIVVTGP